jgi:hypothetical protein
MPIRPCRRVRHAHPAWVPLPGPEEALATILAATSHPPAAETVCLLLDAAHCGLGCVNVDGTADDDAVYRVADFLVDVALERTQLAAVVLATTRPGRSHLPEPGDHLRFLDLRAIFDDVGVQLLDWFVIAGGYASSLAELTDARPLWRGSG